MVGFMYMEKNKMHVKYCSNSSSSKPPLWTKMFVIIGCILSIKINMVYAQGPGKCDLTPTPTEPCSYICDLGFDGFQRAATPPYGTCYKIDAFPMYGPQIQVHVRLRGLRSGCGCCPAGIFVGLQAVGGDWNPVGVIRVPALDVASNCMNEDSLVAGFNAVAGTLTGFPPPDVFVSTKACGSNPAANRTRLQFFGTVSLEFCAIWEFTGTFTSVRFIAEILVLDKVGLPDWNVNAPGSGGRGFVDKIHSELYTFEKTSKTSTTLGNCHDDRLLTEPDSALTKFRVRPTTTTTSTTTTTTPAPTTTTTTPAPTTTTTTPAPTTTTLTSAPTTTTTQRIIIQPPITTSTTTTTSTTENPKETRKKIDDIRAKIDKRYKQCEKTKICFSGVSTLCTEDEEKHGNIKTISINTGRDECVRNRKCKFLFAYGLQAEPEWNVADNQIVVQMSGESPHWIAIGFSRDGKMGDDFVVECVNSGGNITAFTSWNFLKGSPKRNIRTNKTEYESHVRAVDGFTFEGITYCTVALLETINYKGRTFSFKDKRYKILMALGSVKAEDGNLSPHGADKMFYSPINHIVGQQVGPNPYQQNLIRWHGYVMFLIWMLIVPISNFISRSYKETFQAIKICGVKLWYFIHVFLSSLGLILLFFAYGLLTEANSTWHSLLDEFSVNVNYHLWFALCCSSLYFFNVYTGCFIQETYRGQKMQVSNFVHGLTGHVSYGAALLALWTSPKNLFASVPCSVGHIMIVWMVVYHLYVFGIMKIHSNFIRYAIHLITNGDTNHPLLGNVERLFQNPSTFHLAEAPGSRWRKISVIIFLSITFVFWLALTLIAVTADQSNACFKFEDIVENNERRDVKVDVHCTSRNAFRNIRNN